MLPVNGTPVINLQHLAQLVTTCTDTYLRFECDYSEIIVVNRQQAAAGTHAVLQDHSIPTAMSHDIQQTLTGIVWPPPLDDKDAQQQQQVGLSKGQQQQPAAVGAGAAAAVVAAAAAAAARGASSGEQSTGLSIGGDAGSS